MKKRLKERKSSSNSILVLFGYKNMFKSKKEKRSRYWNESTVVLFLFLTGEQAIRQIVQEGRKVADNMPNGAKKGEVLRLCDEVEMLTNQLADLSRKGLVSYWKCAYMNHFNGFLIERADKGRGVATV
jgi:hypothetical protein